MTAPYIETTPRFQKPTLRLVLASEFGIVTDITQDLTDSSMDSIFWALRAALAGCGFSQQTIEEFLPAAE